MMDIFTELNWAAITRNTRDKLASRADTMVESSSFCMEVRGSSPTRTPAGKSRASAAAEMALAAEYLVSSVVAVRVTEYWPSCRVSTGRVAS